MDPILSIGLPVYNAEKYLDAALDSLLGQDFADFELIISDNASTDGTEAICRRHASADPRIRYHRSGTNQGATWNFRRVLELARGRYFKWAAHDDECRPSMVGKCVAALEREGPQAVLAYALSEFIDESGAVMLQNHVSPHWDRIATRASAPHARLAHVLRRNLFGQPIYGVIRTDALRRTPPFGRVAADWVKLAELAMLGCIVEVPEVLFRMRRHGQNTALQYRDWAQLLLWHDPGARRPASWMPQGVAIYLEYLRSVRALPLAPADRLRCLGVAALLPPARGIWMAVLKVTGPLRIRLQMMTRWRWLSRGGASPK